jgi:hypothetical protein
LATLELATFPHWQHFHIGKEDKGLRTKDKGGEKPSFVVCRLPFVLNEIISALACVFEGNVIPLLSTAKERNIIHDYEEIIQRKAMCGKCPCTV